MSLSHHLHQNRLDLLRIAEITSRPLPLREMLTWHRATNKLIGEHIRLARAIHRLQEPPRLLSRLVRHLPRLVCLEFAQQGIRDHPPFVPQELEKSDANSLGRPGDSIPVGDMSPRCGPVLTDSQWALIRGTLESLQAELDFDRKYRRHIPRPDARLLLEGILLKLAFGIPWDDLPDLFRNLHPPPISAAHRSLVTDNWSLLAPFPLRAARELYRQLYLSGRMALIYRRLAWHLRLHGGTTPEELVASGAFLLDGLTTCPERSRRVRLSPEADLTWQTFTALLLLQRAFHNYRALLRERDLGPHRRRPYLRLSSVHGVVASERTRERGNLPSAGATRPPILPSADIRSSETRKFRHEFTAPPPPLHPPPSPKFSNLTFPPPSLSRAHRLPFTIYQSPITDYRSPPTDHRPRGPHYPSATFHFQLSTLCRLAPFPCPHGKCKGTTKLLHFLIWV